MWDFHSHQVAMQCLVVMDKVSLPPSAGLRVGLGRFHLYLRVTDTFLAWGRVPTMRGHWPLCGHLPQSISRTPSLGNGQSQRALFISSSAANQCGSPAASAEPPAPGAWGCSLPHQPARVVFIFFPYTPVSPSVKWDSGMLQKSQQSTYLYIGEPPESSRLQPLPSQGWD